MADINFFDLFFKASFLVKSVMLILVIFSITSWTIIIQRSRILNQVIRRTLLFENKFWSGINLTRLYQEGALHTERLTGIEKIFQDGFKAFSRLQHVNGCMPTAMVEGSVRAMRVALNREIEKVEIYIPLLATVGSVSPYIGLLGTVWGIMQAFIALGGVKQATLPMVAPAIAEALIATAIGLVAAIPAVIAHNRFSLQVNKIEQNYVNFMEEFTAILHRQAFLGQ